MPMWNSGSFPTVPLSSHSGDCYRATAELTVRRFGGHPLGLLEIRECSSRRRFSGIASAHADDDFSAFGHVHAMIGFAFDRKPISSASCSSFNFLVRLLTVRYLEKRVGPVWGPLKLATPKYSFFFNNLDRRFESSSAPRFALRLRVARP
jgi:hypothetical protein